MSDGTKPKEYKIKVPVYASEIYDWRANLFSGDLNNDTLINNIIENLADKDGEKLNIKSEKKNKTVEKYIQKVVPIKVDLSGDQALLLQMTSYNTNLGDGFVQTDNNFEEIKKNTKIGSDTNFMLMYPYIHDLSESLRYHWIILLYEDPNKDSSDVITTAKLVLKRMLGIKVKNIKLNSAIQTIRDKKVTPKFILKVTTSQFDSESENVRFKEYLLQCKVKSTVEYVYQNMPSESAISLMESDTTTSGWVNDTLSKAVKVVKSAFIGPKEIRVTQRYDDEVVSKITQTVEEIYNSEIEISENDLQERIYDVNFVISKLQPVLVDYLQNGTNQ